MNGDNLQQLEVWLRIRNDSGRYLEWPFLRLRTMGIHRLAWEDLSMRALSLFKLTYHKQEKL